MAPNIEQEINALLAGYAMGRLPAPLAVLVEGHLEINPVNRRFVADLEALSGRLIEDEPPATISRRDDRLAAIFSLPDEQPAPPPQAAKAHRLPAAIRAFAGGDVDKLPWKTVLPGFREVKLGAVEGMKTSLFLIRAGQKIPSHTHEGGEVTLVIEGGFSDLFGAYDRGDISITDSSVDHRPVADDDGDCLCFAVTDAPLRLTGLIGRWLNPFIRV